MQEQDQVDFKKATNCHIYEKALVKKYHFWIPCQFIIEIKQLVRASKQKAIQADSALLPSKMCGDWRSTLLEDSMQMIPTTLRAIILPMMPLLAVSNLLWPSTQKKCYFNEKFIGPRNKTQPLDQIDKWIKNNREDCLYCLEPL